MDSTELWNAVENARRLYALTRDPLMLSSIERLLPAIRKAEDLPDGADYQPTKLECSVLVCLERMETARLTLGL